MDWMGRVALELVGHGGLGYSFDPLLRDTKDEYGDHHLAMIGRIVEHIIATMTRECEHLDTCQGDVLLNVAVMELGDVSADWMDSVNAGFPTLARLGRLHLSAKTREFCPSSSAVHADRPACTC